MTQTLTTERLIQIRHSFIAERDANADIGRPSYDEAIAIVDELLANREAQPVGFASDSYMRELKNSGVVHAWLRRDGDDPGFNVKLYTAPPAPAAATPVYWEMRYWNSGHGCFHDWERITEEQHAELSVKHAADNDYDFRVLYTEAPAPEGGNEK